MLTWNFGGRTSNPAWTFIKLASADGNCSYNYNWQLDMLDNDNIMTVNASEVVQKIATDEKDGMYDAIIA